MVKIIKKKIIIKKEKPNIFIEVNHGKRKTTSKSKTINNIDTR